MEYYVVSKRIMPDMLLQCLWILDLADRSSQAAILHTTLAVAFLLRFLFLSFPIWSMLRISFEISPFPITCYISPGSSPYLLSSPIPPARGYIDLRVLAYSKLFTTYLLLWQYLFEPLQHIHAHTTIGMTWQRQDTY